MRGGLGASTNIPVSKMEIPVFEGAQQEWRWTEFVEEFCARFGESNLIEVVEQFNKLRQERIVDEYQTQFDELKSRLGHVPSMLDEEYFVSSFLSGLNDKLRPMENVEYLGHIIIGEGMLNDPKKKTTAVEWPHPKTIKELRGFLGLTDYYRKFIKGYGIINKPLIELLKKNGFEWGERAAIAFNSLKEAMTQAPILSLPKFSKSFILETNASDVGVGAMLTQDEVSCSYEGTPWAQELMISLAAGGDEQKGYTLRAGLLRYIGRMVIGEDPQLRTRILQALHASPIGGHSGLNVTYNNGLPRSEEKNTILVVVDKLTKFGYFLSLAHPFTTSDVARILLDLVEKIHGLPLSITSDRDKIFTNNFWRELFEQLGVGLHMSIAYHPKTDGQTERVNQCLEAYLRCVCFTRPKSWNQWLPVAQWCYNSNFHNSLKRSPFEALFGYKPPLIPAVMHYSNVEWDVD
ncbi:uncharacterized protein LOC127793149 [Diospyros lotus]|uniref:uncharacterized protein LOC127793149 n=1 Tax=Diospyros lotus TaxID=55363 RepID=UPI00224D5B5A|nr:uncharacterized protein LOC127793149 [Diospyros lotus]